MLLHRELAEEILDVDVSKELTPEEISVIMDRYDRHHLLIFRNQTLTENELIRFSSYFSLPISGIIPTHRLLDFPVISVASNMKDSAGKPLGSMIPDDFWHSDGYFLENPHKATILYAKNVPAEGGDTKFVNMCIAYDTLDSAIKEKIEYCRVIYKNAYKNRPPVIHPLVRVNASTKRKSLFVNKYKTIKIEGMKEKESLELLHFLYEHAIKSENIYSHKWRIGDLAVWNNPSTMHLASYPQDGQPRVLYRIVTQGEQPLS